MKVGIDPRRSSTCASNASKHFRERCADANLDRHQRLRAGGDHQEETSSERVPAHAATDLVADALRETAAETSGCGRRANRNQPRILQATESIRVLTGHYWVEIKIHPTRSTST